MYVADVDLRFEVEACNNFVESRQHVRWYHDSSNAKGLVALGLPTFSRVFCQGGPPCPPYAVTAVRYGKVAALRIGTGAALRVGTLPP